MKKKKIPSKNYVILLGIIILVICACFAANNLYHAYKENKVRTSPLATKQVLYADLKNTTKEMNADTFLVISYLENESVHSSEKDIKKVLNKYNLLDNVIYLDITDYRNNQNFFEELNTTLNLTGNLQVKKFPAVVYYKEGIPTYMIDSKDHLLSSGDFEQLIEMYELAS